MSNKYKMRTYWLYCGGRIMLWVCLSSAGIGEFVRIKIIMEKASVFWKCNPGIETITQMFMAKSHQNCFTRGVECSWVVQSHFCLKFAWISETMFEYYCPSMIPNQMYWAQAIYYKNKIPVTLIVVQSW
jgi:hypothetical protein